MSVYKHSYRLEMLVGQDQRTVDADSFDMDEEWVIFYRRPPQGGGDKEYWRVRTVHVVCIETKPGK